MNVSLCNLIRLQNGATPANDSRHHDKQGAGGYFFPPTLSATSSARLPVHHTKKTTGARQIQNSAAHPPRHSRALCPRSASLFPLGVQHARHLDQADVDRNHLADVVVSGKLPAQLQVPATCTLP